MQHARHLLALLLVVVFSGMILAQEPVETEQSQPAKIFVVIKNDGARFIGPIVSQNLTP